MREIDIQTKADILSSALPYMQKYKDKVLVIKYGGHAMNNEEIKEVFMSDISLLKHVGLKIVLVHGGGPQLSETLKIMNIESKFVDGMRYTSKETAKVAQSVLSGDINKSIVASLNAYGVNAIGLSGVDNKMVNASFLNFEKYGYVGQIDSIDESLIIDLLDKGYTPVISSIAHNENRNVLNINADMMAGAFASALKCENLLILTDIKGILRDVEDEKSLISKIKISELQALINQKVIAKGMIPKVDCCISAIRNGVNQAIIIDGRIKHSILIELFSDKGIGTMLIK